MKKIFHNRGFALIYTLLFIVLLLIVISATWFTGMADLRLSQRSVNSSQAALFAKMGIDAGWVKYKNNIGRNNPRPTYNFPASYSCLDTAPSVNRVDLSVDPPTETVIPSLNAANIPSLDKTSIGVYDYRICDNGTVIYIQSVGYFKGNKVTLKAIVTHPANEISTDCQTMNPDGINCDVYLLDHSHDYITTNQTGSIN